ncbi:MAG: copper chaperone PCu(A)C [Betaproteobacteria bacterium]|nr:copper chaperone PCu(A)C [Betaproteobacteria bacterium]
MKQYSMVRRIALFLGLVAMGLANAEMIRLGPLQIDGVYARATVPGQEVGAAYLTIENSGATMDRLIAASSTVARSVLLHSSQMDQGMARMHHETSLDIPAHGRVEMKPGGLHLMLQDLKQPLHEGETIHLTLKFEKSGEVELTVPVKSLLPKEEMAPMHQEMTY